MSTTTNTCPSWCAYRDDVRHDEFDRLTPIGEKHYGAQPGSMVRTHARHVGSVEISGEPVAIEIEQSELLRGGVSEFGPLLLSFDLPEHAVMTAVDARGLAAHLLLAAHELEQTA